VVRCCGLLLFLFLAGIIYSCCSAFFTDPEKGDCTLLKKYYKKNRTKTKRSSEEQKFKLVLAFQNSLIGKNPVMAIVSFTFHLCLFISPDLCCRT